jgi:hypothetical protein
MATEGSPHGPNGHRLERAAIPSARRHADYPPLETRK